MCIVVRSGRPTETRVVIASKGLKERVALSDRRDAGEAQLLHQAILERPVGPFDTTLGAGLLAQTLSMLRS